jgi:hypothetical protein
VLVDGIKQQMGVPTVQPAMDTVSPAFRCPPPTSIMETHPLIDRSTECSDQLVTIPLQSAPLPSTEEDDQCFLCNEPSKDGLWYLCACRSTPTCDSCLSQYVEYALVENGYAGCDVCRTPWDLEIPQGCSAMETTHKIHARPRDIFPVYLKQILWYVYVVCPTDATDPSDERSIHIVHSIFVLYWVGLCIDRVVQRREGRASHILGVLLPVSYLMLGQCLAVALSFLVLLPSPATGIPWSPFFCLLVACAEVIDTVVISRRAEARDAIARYSLRRHIHIRGRKSADPLSKYESRCVCAPKTVDLQEVEIETVQELPPTPGRGLEMSVLEHPFPRARLLV